MSALSNLMEQTNVAEGDVANLANPANSPCSISTNSSISTSGTETPNFLRAERRRQKVLQMMSEAPPAQRYFLVTDDKADAEYVVLALGIRDIGTCELSIPRERYDGFKLIEILTLDGACGVPVR